MNDISGKELMITKEHIQRVRNKLNQINDPISFEQHPRVKVDMPGIIKYATERGMRVIDLSDEERRSQIFISVRRKELPWHGLTESK